MSYTVTFKAESHKRDVHDPNVLNIYTIHNGYARLTSNDIISIVEDEPEWKPGDMAADPHGIVYIYVNRSKSANPEYCWRICSSLTRYTYHRRADIVGKLTRVLD